MRKCILIFTLNLLIGIIGFGQQSELLSDSFIDLLQNKDILLNRKLINPTNLTDSNKYLINLEIHLQTMRTENPKNGFFVSSETNLPSINSSIGINIDFRNLGYFQHRSFNASYKYQLEFDNKMVLNFGFNIGIWQYEYNYTGFNSPILFPIETGWINSPLLDIGVSYKYKNQALSLSYNNIINSNMKLGNSDNYLKLNGFIANYQSIFNISKKLSIIPEIYGCFDSTDNYGIIVSKLNFSKIIEVGLLYNTKKSVGMSFSGLIKDKFRIRYFYEIDNIIEPRYNGSPYALSIGVIL